MQPTPAFNTATSNMTSNPSSSNHSTVSSSVTEVYRDHTPPPTPSNINHPINHIYDSSDLSYDMTSVQTSSHNSFNIGDMVMANGQVVHIISSSFNPQMNTVSYAVKTTTNEIFVAPAQSIQAIPSLPNTPKSSSSHRSNPSKSSYSHRDQRSYHSPSRRSKKPSSHHHNSKASTKSISSKSKSTPPVSKISINDDSSFQSTIKTNKTSTESPVAVISSMRREFKTEIAQFKAKEQVLNQEIEELKNQVSQLQSPPDLRLGYVPRTYGRMTPDGNTKFIRQPNNPYKRSSVSSVKSALPNVPEWNNTKIVPPPITSNSSVKSSPSTPTTSNIQSTEHLTTNPTIPPTTVNNSITNASTSPTTPTVIDLIKIMAPPPSFVIPSYNPKESKQWLQRVIALLSGSPYFSILLTQDKTAITDVVPPDGAAADATLYTRLTKALTKEQLTIMTSDTADTVNLASGVAILHCIAADANVVITPNQARLKYKMYESIERGTRESISSYTARIIQAAKDLAGTAHEPTIPQRNIKWRLGLGNEFTFINRSIDILGIIPDGWGDDKNIYHLLRAADSYSKEIGENTPPTPSLQATNPSPTSPSPQVNATPPSAASSLERYQRHVRWMIGHGEFERDPSLELGPKYIGKRPNGCAYCDTDNHKWATCTRILGCKRNRANANPPTNTTPNPVPPPPNPTPSPAPPAPEARRITELEQSPDDSTAPSTPVTDNSNNANVDVYYSSTNSSNIIARVLKSVTTSPHTSSSDIMILDSGTTHHMTGNKSLFTSLLPLPSPKFVILGDGRTTTPIEALGTIDILIGKYRIILHEVYYVPSLQDTLFSIKQHMSYHQCTFHAEDDNMTLTFPQFSLTADTTNEVQLTISPTPVYTSIAAKFNSKFAQQVQTPPKTHRIQSTPLTHNLISSTQTSPQPRDGDEFYYKNLLHIWKDLSKPLESPPPTKSHPTSNTPPKNKSPITTLSPP